jgi:hypothetical protein
LIYLSKNDLIIIYELIIKIVVHMDTCGPFPVFRDGYI